MILNLATSRGHHTALLRAIMVGTATVLGAALLPAQNWVQRSPGASPSARNGAAFAFDEARGRAVLFGGYDNATPAFGDTWEWDSGSWLARTTAASPSPRWGHRMIYDSQRRRAVLFGGYNPAGGFLGDTWEWDGTSWTLRTAPSSPAARGYHGMAFDRARGQTVLFAGSAGAQNYFGDTWTWNGTTWSLASTPSSPGPRRDMAMAYDTVRQETVLFGGATNVVFADTWVWNGTTWSQRYPAIAPAARCASHAAFDMVRGKLQLFGGATANFATNFADTWEWDGVAWNQAAAGPSARHGHVMTYDSWRGNTVLFGGRDATAFHGDTWEAQPASPPAGIWAQRATTGPNRRRGAAMAYYTPAAVTVLFGGMDYSQTGHTNVVFGDTWRWNGASWQASSASGPLVRTAHAMVFDSQRNCIVMFGGATAASPQYTPLGDTWEWNGATWAQAAAGPPARHGHGMAYDAARGRVVLFGGYDNTSYLGDTWEWDGAAWQSPTTTQSPSPRYRYAMAYDAQRGRTVLQGGHVANGSFIGDTWEWDGAAWASSAGAGPGARSGHAMSFDAARGRLVLFGGWDANSLTTNDTWERVGTTWTQVASTGPLARIDHAMAYDSQRQRTVLFGGDDVGPWPNAAPLADTWEMVQGNTATAFALAYGFGCGTPALALAPDPLTRPLLGSTPRATISNAPSGIAFVAMGLNRATFGALPIPVSLASYGLPGCDLLQAADLGAAYATTSAGAGVRQFQLPLANQSVLLGLHLYLQAWAPAPGANAASVIVSNGVEWRLGNI